MLRALNTNSDSDLLSPLPVKVSSRPYHHTSSIPPHLLSLIPALIRFRFLARLCSQGAELELNILHPPSHVRPHTPIGSPAGDSSR